MLCRCIILLFLSTIVSPAEFHDAAFDSFVLKKMPPYLPRQDMERLFKAAKSRFYENQVETARITMDRMKNVQFLQSRAEEAEEENEKEATCEDLLMKGVLDYFLRKPYALTMDDAHGKEESGLFQGNYMWLGRYFECQGQTDGKNLVADMCVGIIGDTENPTAGIFLSVCVPNACTPEDLKRIYEPGNGTYITVFCPGRDKTWDAVDIVALVILSILGLLVIGGTCFELFLVFKNRQNFGGNKKVSSRLLLSFSIIRNTKTLLNTKRKEGNVSVLDGIRVLSMAWVVLGHTLSFSMITIDNLSDLANYFITHGSALAVANGTLSVDSFFFLSGLLVAYLGLKEYKKKRSLGVAKMYLHRYLRLTPAMALVMLFSVSLYEKIGSGPLYEYRNEAVAYTCQKYWWTNLLYINNLYPANLEDQCIGWVWYLANDMQFYLLSPIFVILLFRHTKVALGILGFLIVTSAAITGALSTEYELWPDIYYYGLFTRWFIFILSPSAMSNSLKKDTVAPFSDDLATSIPQSEYNEDSYWNDTYGKPWCRMDVYFIGMITGYLLYSKKNIKMNKMLVTLMWIGIPVIELAVVYGFWWNIEEGDYLNPVSIHLLAFYNAVVRPVWALGLAWLTIACTYGYGGPITPILSFKAFIPLSRLTFCAYLIHPLILTYMFMSFEVQPHFRIDTYIYYFLAAIVLSFACAYLLSMLIEAPVAEMQKVIFSSRRTDPKDQNKTAAVLHVDGNGTVMNDYDVASFGKEKMGVVNEIELEEEKVSYLATDAKVEGERL